MEDIEREFDNEEVLSRKSGRALTGSPFPEAGLSTGPGKFTTVLRPHQLRRGDVYTDHVPTGGTRDVSVDTVEYGEVYYRGRMTPVLFVTGYDHRLNKVVKYTRTSWEFLTVTRVGAEPPRPQHYIVNGRPAAEPFVY